MSLLNHSQSLTLVQFSCVWTLKKNLSNIPFILVPKLFSAFYFPMKLARVILNSFRRNGFSQSSTHPQTSTKSRKAQYMMYQETVYSKLDSFLRCKGTVVGVCTNKVISKYLPKFLICVCKYGFLTNSNSLSLFSELFLVITQNEPQIINQFNHKPAKMRLSWSTPCFQFP